MKKVILSLAILIAASSQSAQAGISIGLGVGVGIGIGAGVSVGAGIEADTDVEVHGGGRVVQGSGCTTIAYGSTTQHKVSALMNAGVEVSNQCAIRGYEDYELQRVTCEQVGIVPCACTTVTAICL